MGARDCAMQKQFLSVFNERICNNTWSWQMYHFLISTCNLYFHQCQARDYNGKPIKSQGNKWSPLDTIFKVIHKDVPEAHKGVAQHPFYTTRKVLSCVSWESFGVNEWYGFDRPIILLVNSWFGRKRSLIPLMEWKSDASPL